MATVLICDDHGRVHGGLHRQVADLPGVDRVTTAATADEVLARWSAERPALVLMDLDLPGLGGLETTRRLVAAYPEATVVVLAADGDRESVAQAIAGGARGYLVKNASATELGAVIAGALAGIADVIPAQATPADRPQLTEREQQVLEGMAQGRTNAEIGRELYLSEDTIKTHARRLFRKLDAGDRAQAVALGFRHGLVR